MNNEINFEDSVDELIFLLNKPSKEGKNSEAEKKSEEKLLNELKNLNNKNFNENFCTT